MNEAQPTGRLFGHRDDGGESCHVEASAAGLVARVDGTEYRFRFDQSELSYGGTDDSMLVAEYRDGDRTLSLYWPREIALRELRGQGVDQLLATLESGRVASRRSSVLLWAGVVLAHGVLVICLALGVDALVGWGITRVPPEWEVDLGQLLMDQMHDESERVEDPAVRDGIDPIVDRLLYAIDHPEYRFEVHVIRSDEVNAFALPGGQIAVYTGLLEKCESPEELAGVLAHELQHVLHRHSLEAIAGQVKWSILLSLVIGDLDTVRGVVLGKASEVLSLSHGRDAEREADREGLDLLFRASIAPEGMVTFFETLHELETALPQGLSFLSTHPGGVERVDAIRQGIEERGKITSRPIEIDWPAFKAAARETEE